MKLTIREIGRVEYPDQDSTYDDMEPAPWEPSEGEEVRLRMEERKAAWDRGDWWAVGVTARAELMWVDDDTGLGTHGIVGPVESPGLWGVESDSGEDYLEDIYREELSTLRAMLKAMGFNDDDINQQLTDEEVKCS